MSSGPAFGLNDLGHKAGGNSTVTFLRYFLTAVVSNAFTFNDTNSIEGTDITTTIYTTTSDDNDIYYPKEVVVFDLNYGDTGWYGQWYCNSWGAGNVCNVGHVNINLYPEPPLPLNDTEARSIVCEEVGHAVGLDHSGAADSCMSQDWNDTKLNTSCSFRGILAQDRRCGPFLLRAALALEFVSQVGRRIHPPTATGASWRLSGPHALMMVPGVSAGLPVGACREPHGRIRKRPPLSGRRMSKCR